MEQPHTALPPDFLTTLTAPDPELLAAALESPSPISVRLNPLKYSGKFSDLPPVNWATNQGRYLPNRPVFTADPALHGGAYYVQEASSMFVGWLVTQLELDGTTPLRALDLCAAPGGKSTHLSSILGPESLVVANEIIRPRARTLAENVQKWGDGNTVVTSSDPKDFGDRLPSFFDLMLIDAPCSGEGMFRKDHAARGEWSLAGVELCAQRARRIVSDAWATLADGGVLIFSTCTFNDSENDTNVEWIARELGGTIVNNFDLLPQGIFATRSGYQLYPHRIIGEGLYAAVIIKDGAPIDRKQGGKSSRHGYDARSAKRSRSPLTQLSKSEAADLPRWIAGDTLRNFALGGGQVYGFSDLMYESIPVLLDNLAVLYSGVLMGEMIRGELKPAHSLALYSALNREAITTTELSIEQAMEYLRKGSGPDPELFENGLNLISYQGVGLGWIKRINARCNNLYPVQWRVLNY